MARLTDDPSFAAALTAIAANRTGEVALVQGLRPALVAAAGQGRPCLVVTAGGVEADVMAAQAVALVEAKQQAFVLPAWETLLSEPSRPSALTVGQRARVIAAVAQAGPSPMIFSSLRALVQPIFGPVAEGQSRIVAVGSQVSRDSLLEELVTFGYERIDLVEKRGEFAVRGSIVDLFVPTDEHPVRIEFDDDEVVEIRYFSVADQRSIEELAEVTLWPAIEPMTGSAKSIIDLLPKDLLVLLVDPERVEARADDLLATDDAFRNTRWQQDFIDEPLVESVDDHSAKYFGLAEVKRQVISDGGGWLGLTPFLRDEPQQLAVDSVVAHRFRGDLNVFKERVREWFSLGWQIVVAMPGHGSLQRMAEFLQEHEVPTLNLSDASAIDSDRVNLWQGPWVEGFELPQSRLVWLAESDIFGKGLVRRATKMPTRRKGDLDPLTLKRGEYVVHYQHGVGRFVEIATRELGGAQREYLVVEYAPSKRGQPADLLYVPTDQLHMITKYVGGESPGLSRLGGSDWQKTKARARRAVKDIADQLVGLYAARAAAKGTAFSPDTRWQRELEDAFTYVETPDQLVCIDEVKVDMEKPTPMDRVIAGDVGYGKTEIAIRAAFKAVQDGKQVAVLVPTTLLVQQHLATFSERYANFPVTVGALSRFQSDAEAQKVLQSLSDGSLDVVIGTHRMLTSKIRFHDIGLVIVDEEQRFGVEHKEFLKALKNSVDVLTLSATPIPRTLEMAITGIRDLSVIQTPPEERLPVHTYVGPYDEGQVAAAIRRELVRDGQVFYVHNRVESIDRVAIKLGELVPEARVAIAHGQMPERLLEQVILDFWAAKFDVLVCTTIVESGLDIANANTLIVDAAERLGLAQLHQLRGRVGRSDERAHAYFFYSPSAALNEGAYQRLATIAQHQELGAGMAVAMKDLEIRGAGNLLGGEQSGHIAEVGFDLYVRLVTEALAEHKGETEKKPDEIRIDLPIAALVPAHYVSDERLRLDVYRRIAATVDDAEVEQIHLELQDRFGELPRSTVTLLSVARLRNKARHMGISEISAYEGNVRISPVELSESSLMRVQRLNPGSKYRTATRTLIVPTGKIRATVAIDQSRHKPDDEKLLDWLDTLLTDEIGVSVAV